jgi:peptide-methionine (S)-S-oxide reductase
MNSLQWLHFEGVLMPTSENARGREVASLAGGCFWCLEAVYLDVKGVESVVSGYMGGNTSDPTYEDVCTGATGHAEIVQVTFDPAVISYREILQIFFVIHDPTTLNRQGNDVGTQYRSAIFYHSPEQKSTAEEVVSEVTRLALYSDRIVTEITAASRFHAAEDYHQRYFARNPFQPYCQYVVAPKVAKFRKQFVDRLKKEKA